ncbi:Protein N-terminal and lysine N-methyltransferase efm7 [Candidozyma auris]|uniref:Protein N-terminal and lysine N-methyltransferase EFM7 n=2 Tax=Candidozyma auris TaxID=498019 RepID=A0A2H0ZDQ8_CANAR|nr:S-adenosylmethionine-dependent methyltransferase [[Candida] auris]KND96897.1 hypothetical protein QG37_06767 [[Candida] auris]PIS48767.1 hypothetical protein B9J08_005471 [[Candida] auris]PSK77189.1 hypothetical protein CJJ07_002986 [[Candida] auris]QEO23845.1 hypothetical_protein [[Candida] auris]QWW24493.1 hypothetical protein CA7LBN_003350 [[Candida] auris]
MSDTEIDAGLFEEPEGFRPPPPESHFVEYERVSGKTDPTTIKLKLVGKSPLWGHLLWNAGKFTANYLDAHAEELVRGKKVLELGAAAALPSLVCAVNGASKVISSDYPDPELIDHIQYNIDHCEGIPKDTIVKAKGYIWGNDVRALCYDDIEDESALPKEIKEEDKFDLVILSDLVFNHREHLKLLSACRKALKASGTGLVVFSPHRPHLLDEDLKFFETSEQFDFKAEQIACENWTPMFEEDEATAEIRSRVYCFKIHPQW